MDLWIRSQDRMNLCKVHDLVIRENHSGYGDIDYVIQDTYTMATYKTKERAIEVLDEIQRLMIASLIDKNLDGYGVVIYEMPKE